MTGLKAIEGSLTSVQITWVASFLLYAVSATPRIDSKLGGLTVRASRAQQLFIVWHSCAEDTKRRK